MAVNFIGRRNRSTRKKPPICRKSMTNFITYCTIDHTSPWVEFEFTPLVVIGTDYTGSFRKRLYTPTEYICPVSIPWSSLCEHQVDIFVSAFSVAATNIFERSIKHQPIPLFCFYFTSYPPSFRFSLYSSTLWLYFRCVDA